MVDLMAGQTVDEPVATMVDLTAVMMEQRLVDLMAYKLVEMMAAGRDASLVHYLVELMVGA